MSDIHAPYNFVPVANYVARGWYKNGEPILPEQDAPWRDGLCGQIPLTLIAETPLLVSDGRTEERDGIGVRRFSLSSDKRPEIPGTSLKGMLRAVVEIASFSAMTLIEDRRFGLRDLSGPSADSYRRKFQYQGNGQGKSLGGWLRRATSAEHVGQDPSGWVIEPCEVTRYAHDSFTGDFAEAFRRLQKEKKLEKKEAPRIYAAFARAHGTQWQSALAVGNGELVFTGNPSRKKRKEFVFETTGEPPVPVPDHVWRGFLDVHERQEKPSSTWMWWKKRLQLEPWNPNSDGGLPQDPTDRIPVFWLRDGPEVTSMGLAQMFKMSGSVSTRAALPEAHREQTLEPDLAELLFGRVTTDGAQSFRGRVSLDAGQLTNRDYAEKDMGETVTSTPKPGFFPAYLRQQEPPPGSRRRYVTWVDENAQMRGWKRYPVQKKEAYKPPAPPEGISKSSRSRLMPIVPKPGDGPLEFETMLRFHNLRPFELGALLWALDFGGDVTSRHSLGMGKPYGWGCARLEVGSPKIAANDPTEKPTSLESYRDEFVKQVTIRVPGWENSHQIRALREMAHPSEDPLLRSMILDPQKGINEFQDARNAGAILPPPAGIVDWLPAAPRKTKTHKEPPKQAGLFRKGEEVRDIEQGDFGEVVEDQMQSNEDVLVDFNGAQERISAQQIERS